MNELTIVNLLNPIFVIPNPLNLECYWRLFQQDAVGPASNQLLFQFNNGSDVFITAANQTLAPPNVGAWEYRIEGTPGVNYILSLYKGGTLVNFHELSQADISPGAFVTEWFFRWNVNLELRVMARTDFGNEIEVSILSQDTFTNVPECEPEPPNPNVFSLDFFLCALSYFYQTPQEYVEKLIKLRDHFVIVKSYLQKIFCCNRRKYDCGDNMTEEILNATVIGEINVLISLIEVLIMSLVADYGSPNPSAAVIDGFQRLFDFLINSQGFVLLDENNNQVTSLDDCTIVSYGIKNYICPGLLITRFIVSV